MMVKHIRFTAFLRLLALALVFLSACSVAPVQEMSDARQAIQAAKDAGAPQRSPSEFELAQQMLERAQKALELGEYQRARSDALSAKRQALTAREKAIEHPAQ